MRRETFDTPGEVTLDLRVAAGRIDIEAVQGATSTEIELDARGNGDEVRDLLEETRIEARERQGGYEVVVHIQDRRRLGFGFWRKVDVRLSIRVPEGAKVQFEGASADLRGRGRFGALEADSASGDVEFDEVLSAKINSASGDVSARTIDGAAEVNTASGDVELGRVGGPLDAKTASGDIEVDEAGAGVKIKTASGDQRIGGVTAGIVDVQSMSGDITVGIRQGSNVWVDARAMSGDLSSELELGDEQPVDDEAPLVELRAASMSGDVRVLRA
jgi:Putative adhesin